jgi:hypothetical protein
MSDMRQRKDDAVSADGKVGEWINRCSSLLSRRFCVLLMLIVRVFTDTHCLQARTHSTLLS